MESLDLTPAESLIIISPKSSGNEMIKITLMDLILRRVLKVNIEENESKFLKEDYKVVIISKGDFFSTNLKPHEKILNDLVLDHSQLELKEFTKMLHNKVNSVLYKDKCLRNNLVCRGYLKRQRKMLLSLIPHTSYVLTNKGLEVRDKIVELFDEAKYLEKWIKEDLGRAKAYLSVTGTHILLSDVYNLEDIKKFNRILSQIKPESKVSDYYSYYLYAVPLGYLDEYGNLDSLDFLDISVLDYFGLFDDFYSDFDAGSGDGGVE
ncbi:MAG: hypothetical protein QMD61_07150 [Methanobacterium sp.]|nr:hypothetical protein [Methanobacterium sp.]